MAVLKRYTGTVWETVGGVSSDAFPLGVGAWTAYTPTNTNVTVGNGTQTASFTRIGRTIFFRYQLTWGGTTAFGAGAVQIGLPPVPAASGQAMSASGSARDATGNSHPVGGWLPSTSQMRPIAVNGNLTSTAPFTWAENDVLTIGGTYEAAA